MQTLLIVVSIN